MTQRQINTIGMFKTVAEYLNLHSEKWSDSPMVNTEVAELKDNIAQIKTITELQAGTSTVGYTKDRDEALHNLTNKAFKLAVRARLYARKAKNNVMLQLVDISQSALEAGAEDKIVARIKAIVKLAEDNAKALANHVAAADVSELRNAIIAFEPLTSKRDAVGDTKSASTTSLSDAIAAGKDILDNLDDAIEGFVNDTEFQQGYQSARAINDRHARGEAKTAV